MTKMIKMTLLAAAFAASAPYAMARDNGSKNDGMNNGGGMYDGSMSNKPGNYDGREELLDREPTGSIQGCDTGAYDANGNCVMTAPDMQ